MNDTIKYSIVIPVYKSGLIIPELIERIVHVMQSFGTFELILVDDCSSDEITWKAVQKSASMYSFVRGISLLANVGQFRATMCGLSAAQGDFIITMDDDLQHPPEELPKLIHAMENDPDTLCFMAYYEVKHHNWFRNMGSCFFQSILHFLCGKPKAITTSSFRIMQRSLVDAVLTSRSIKPQISPIILSITRKVKNITVQHAARKEGCSGYKLTTLMTTTLETIINSSTVPLRLYSMIGSFASLFSFLVGCYYLVRWMFWEISVPGYMSQILLLSFIGGMILAGIGIIGEYLSRIVNEITYPKTYFIRETTDHKIDFPK